MALNEKEEFELLSLERARAMSRASPVAAPKEKNGFLDNLKAALTAPRLAGGPMGMLGRELLSSQELFSKAAGGAATDVLATHVPPEVAGFVGAATEVAVPTLAGAIAGRAIAQPVAKAAGERLMSSALKPSSKDLLSGDAAKAVQTMLDEGVNVTAGGAAALRAKISALHNEVAKKIAASPEMVDKAYVASEVSKTLAKFRNQVTPGADRKAILDAWQEFNTRFGAKIPVAEAQAMKQGTQAIISKKYGEIGSAATETQKGMARGLRLGIEDVIPEVKHLNAQESKLLNALYMADRRAALEGNKNIAGLSLLAKNPEAAAAFMVDRSSLFKSLLARMIHSRGGDVGAIAGGAAGGVAGSLSGQE